MVKIRVPATSANLGPGFDCLGLAVTLYNELTAEPWDCVCIEAHGEGAAFIPTGESNLTYRSWCAAYERAGRTPEPVKLVQHNCLPLSRGLGSSAAGIVAGVLAANQMMGEPLSMAQMLDVATRMEGHPDNVAPCLLGGLTASMMAGEHVFTQRAQVHESWRFAAMVPNFVLSTQKARAVLPAQYAKADAVGNIGRAVLMYAALQSGDADMLGAASADAIHQPYRSALIPGWDEVLRTARACGAAAVFLSGAGPTVMSVYRAGQETYVPALKAGLAQISADWQVLDLACDSRGACVI
ncbi:MAG: homoserine kinase [Eubacteriales bacterium]|nr:homoserine kinase [Eubacteriales bacterium]